MSQAGSDQGNGHKSAKSRCFAEPSQGYQLMDQGIG